MPENAVYHKPVKTGEEINTEFIFGQLEQEAPAKCLNDSEMEQLKRWLKRHETVLKPEDSRYLERVFAGGVLDEVKTRKAVFDFFGGISTVVECCGTAERSHTSRNEVLERLQGRFGLKCATAAWVLDIVVTVGARLNPKAEEVEKLRKNFEQQGGHIL